MSWASRRRFAYGGGIFLFLFILVAVPTVLWIHTPPTCFDGKQNQDETGVDKGGSCQLLDERTLIPHAVTWTRGFEVRPGLYSAVAYIDNPNANAGVEKAAYRFSLYDDRNVLVAEREGETYIIPGGVTPVFEGAIDTGNRAVVRTYLELAKPLVWKKAQSLVDALVINNKKVLDITGTPRLTASISNQSVSDIRNISFVAVVFDTAGNAFASSETLLPSVSAGGTEEVVFTWPTPFQFEVGRTDILPLLPPELIGGN